VGPVQGVALLAALAAAPAFACDVPDEGGNTPWRRAVAKVKYLPETEAMAAVQPRERGSVQFVVSLDEPRHLAGRCWWPVDVRVDGRTWKRFLVTPDGSAMREAPGQHRPQ
jgi:hypothetical protein